MIINKVKNGKSTYLVLIAFRVIQLLLLLEYRPLQLQGKFIDKLVNLKIKDTNSIETNKNFNNVSFSLIKEEKKFQNMYKIQKRSSTHEISKEVNENVKIKQLIIVKLYEIKLCKLLNRK